MDFGAISMKLYYCYNPCRNNGPFIRSEVKWCHKSTIVKSFFFFWYKFPHHSYIMIVKIFVRLKKLSYSSSTSHFFLFFLLLLGMSQRFGLRPLSMLLCYRLRCGVLGISITKSKSGHRKILLQY